MVGALSYWASLVKFRHVCIENAKEEAFIHPRSMLKVVLWLLTALPCPWGAHVGTQMVSISPLHELPEKPPVRDLRAVWRKGSKILGRAGQFLPGVECCSSGCGKSCMPKVWNGVGEASGSLSHWLSHNTAVFSPLSICPLRHFRSTQCSTGFLKPSCASQLLRQI